MTGRKQGSLGESWSGQPRLPGMGHPGVYYASETLF